MGQPEPIKTYYTYEEYLALEQTEGIRYEYFQGEAFAMAGGTKRHDQIAGNLYFWARTSLSNTCRIYSSDVKIEIHSQSHYVYPDLAITCDPKDLDNDKDAFLNYPSLVVEVLPKSTRNYDKDQKKNAYMRLPSLEYYLLIEQDKCEVELYERHKDFWAYTQYTKPEQTIKFPKLNLSITLKEIYELVNLDPN